MLRHLTARVECVWAAGARLGECPCWDQRSRRLFWVDIRNARLNAFHPDDAAKHTWKLPHRVCSLDTPTSAWRPPEPLRGEPFIACCDLGLAWIGVDGDAVMFLRIAHPEGDQPDHRFNDGKMGPDNRFWAGTMHDAEETATGSLYAFHPDGSHTVLDDGYRVTNGPAFSADGSVVYHADTARQVVYAFDLQADGTLANRRTFVRFADGEGSPDGMTTDRDGNLWVAMWDGARLEKLAPDGARVGSVPIPTRRPTSCTFVDPQCTEMFVTSASIGSTGEDVLAGGLFRVRLAA